MNAALLLRPAAPADGAALAALDATGFVSDRWDADAWLSELDAPGRRVVLAEADGVVVAAIVTMVLGEVADLVRIVVHPAHRRGGLARRLVVEAAQAAQSAGAERMLLEVSSINDGAIAFYLDLGFTWIDLRPRYYRDDSDALILMRALEPSTAWSAS
ncbi:GNAT family N-acetyltransferase [Nocardioides dubius]|uniref:N-acetyltransferase domain-containing protein n=1 Tax=Nocardioides dubius TaxID=317019 RepID=A0ABN1TWK0_9ACTN